MFTKTLPKVMAIDTPRPTETELVKLATDSTTQLGYSVLNSRIKETEKQKREGLSFAVLTEALRSLEIEVFDSDEVHNYAKEVIDKKRQEDRVITLKVSLIAPTCFLFFAYLTYYFNSNVRFVAEVFSVFTAFSLLASIISFFMRTDTTEANLWEWQKVNLKDYKKPVPEFVLRKALQIKEKCPNVTFFIYELVKRERQINGDPFLAVCYGNDGYFVEVWDEPKFEAKL